MNKGTWMVVNDIVLGLLFVSVISTGLMMGAHIGGHTVHEVHGALALTMLAAVAVHIWLHWGWIWAKATGGAGASPARRAVGGSVLLIAVIAAVLAIGTLLVLGGDDEHEGAAGAQGRPPAHGGWDGAQGQPPAPNMGQGGQPPAGDLGQGGGGRGPMGGPGGGPGGN